MNLFILRHGIAVEPGSSGFDKDADRPLTPKGERKLWKIAQGMRELDLGFDWILSSPYVRARQTAEAVAEAFGLRKRLQLSEHLTPGGSAKKLIQEILTLKPGAGNVLLVGHEPYLSNLVSLLLSGNTDIRIIMKKGGLCKLTAEELEAGPCAILEWLLTPKQMCLMA